MVLVPANMSRLSFGPCKKKFCFWSLQIFLFFKIGGTIFGNKIFCRNLFKKTKYFAGTKNYKMGPVIMCHVCKSSQKWGRDYFKKQKILQGPKTIFFFTGTKT